jgi:peptide deformylase
MDSLCIYPHPLLKKKAWVVENIDGNVKEIADRMAKVMYANKGKD